MAEDSSRAAQFAYKANSNLVLNVEKGRRELGPTGEVESLALRNDAKQLMKQMGTRAILRTVDLSSRPNPNNLSTTGVAGSTTSARKVASSNVLVTSTLSFYEPRTAETQRAYAALLSCLSQIMVGQSHDVLRSAADEVIGVLRQPSIERRRPDLNELLTRPATDEQYRQLLTAAERLNDFTLDAEDEEDRAAVPMDMDEQGVAVQFEDDDDEGRNATEAHIGGAESELDEILESESEDEMEEVEEEPVASLANQGGDHTGEEVQEEQQADVFIDPKSIDAYWLQRKIKSFGGDPHESMQLAENVLSVLASDKDARQVENSIVRLIGFEHFDFVKRLLHNRDLVVYCTRLQRAKDDAERDAIKDAMFARPELRTVLDQLQNSQKTAQDRSRDRERLLMKDVRSLKVASANGVFSTPKSGAYARPFGKPSMIDLESLAFHQGGHFMSNTEWTLPPGSWKKDQKGYQEIFVPPSDPSKAPKTNLMKIDSMPAWSRAAFEGYTSLNPVQSRVYRCALLSADNMLLCAPTGAGKTNVAMLAVLREIGLHRDESTGDVRLDAFKVVYVAPMKSLVREMVGTFSKRLKPYGVTAMELSGDTKLSRDKLDEAQILVTTPEKWDIITRKEAYSSIASFVSLIIIDEIHLLHDSRGPVLEAIVARTVRQVERTQEMTRLVGLSATLPNYNDVATLLRVRDENGLFVFGSEFRPCPLQQVYIGVTAKRPFKQFQKLNELCYERVIEQAGKNQILVFVHSRKDTFGTARYIREQATENDLLGRFVREDSASRKILQTEAESCSSPELKELLPFGIGAHHAGMSKSDRGLVEDLFAEGHLQVLVSTATLAWGVNLPAHSVIIKGTQVYNAELGRWTELSMLDVMQMLGRAGRPQFDSFGEGTILTTHVELKYYMSLLNEQLPVESQLLSNLPDLLNAEVVLGTVRSVADAIDWMSYTYLYVRMLHSPSLYGVDADDLERDPTLEKRRFDLVHIAATALDRAGLLAYDRQTGSLRSTDLGRVSSHFYLSYRSVLTFNAHLKPSMSDISLLRVFALSQEFAAISVREEEKAELAKLLDKVPIPVKESLDEPAAKINVLLQSYISRLSMDGIALLADMVYVTASAGRLLRALFEILLGRGWADAARRALRLCQMVEHRMWSIESPLRQFRGSSTAVKLPADVLRKLEKTHMPWEAMLELEAHELGELVRVPKLGKRVHRLVHMIPRMELSAHVQPVTRSLLRIQLTLTPDFAFEESVHGDAEPFIVLVEDGDAEKVLHHQRFMLRRNRVSSPHLLELAVPLTSPQPPHYFVRVISERWIGSESVLPLSFRHLLLPDRFAPPTDLLDLQPLPISALGQFAELYAQESFSHFNPIQTQTFEALFSSDDNVLVAAPTGSGKTVCSEFALLRMLETSPRGRAIYVAPRDDLLDAAEKHFRRRFAKSDITIERLNGDEVNISGMLTQISKSQLALCNAHQWDVCSRRWRTRKQVQNVDLVLFDDLHLVGGEGGPLLEIVVSRTRSIIAQTGRSIRVVGLAASVSNASDLGGWIGCSQSKVFAFAPSVRPVPMSLHLHALDLYSHEARQAAMLRPSFEIIHAETRKAGAIPVLAFVPGREEARRVAGGLVALAAAEDPPLKLLHMEQTEMEASSWFADIVNPVLRQSLLGGVGFLHEGLRPREREVVRELFEAGAIQVVVVDKSLVFGLGLHATLVLVLGTDSWHPVHQQYSDIGISSLEAMLGCCGRQGDDVASSVTVFCHRPRKAFLSKFLLDAYPVESHLDHFLADHINSEIVYGSITNVQDAVDYLTWTLLYRRLAQNPNYYNLRGTSHRHLSDALSEMVEGTLDDLESAECISTDSTELTVSPLNLGMIAAHYSLRYLSVELVAQSVGVKTRVKGLLGLAASASEFDELGISRGEPRALAMLARRLPLAPPSSDYHDPHTKAHLLLQAHFSRLPLAADVAAEQKKMLPQSLRLLHAIVDVISSQGWLEPVLQAMELSQMVVQGMWADRDSHLLQLPHFTREMAQRCTDASVTTIFDFMELEDEERNKLVSMPKEQLHDVAAVCNRYPNLDLEFEVVDADSLRSGESITLNIQVEREEDEDEEFVGPAVVYAPRFPMPKMESWWVVVGESSESKLLSIKKFSMTKAKHSLKLEMIAPSAGKHTLQLFLMSDCYIGCDQEYTVDIDVSEGAASDEESEDDSEDEGSGDAMVTD